MEKLQINVPDGHEIDLEKSNLSKGEIFFKLIVKKDLSWGEIQEHYSKTHQQQVYLDRVGHIETVIMKRETSLGLCKNHLPSEKVAKKILALCQLYIIAEYYNEGWVPDWKNLDIKYLPTWENKGSTDCFVIIGACTYSYATPAFKSKEVLMRAYEANKEIFETALKT